MRLRVCRKGHSSGGKPFSGESSSTRIRRSRIARAVAVSPARSSLVPMSSSKQYSCREFATAGSLTKVCSSAVRSSCLRARTMDSTAAFDAGSCPSPSSGTTSFPSYASTMRSHDAERAHPCTAPAQYQRICIAFSAGSFLAGCLPNIASRNPARKYEWSRRPLSWSSSSTALSISSWFKAPTVPCRASTTALAKTRSSVVNGAWRNMLEASFPMKKHVLRLRFATFRTNGAIVQSFPESDRPLIGVLEFPDLGEDGDRVGVHARKAL